MNQIFEDPFLGTYWGARKESKLECAKKIVNTLKTLSKWPPLDQWYFCMDEANDPIIPITVTVEEIYKVLEEHRTDFGNILMEDLGFIFFAWCGSLDETCGISFNCGKYNSKFTNCVNLRMLPRIPPKRASEGNDLREMMEIFISIWDPERAIVTSSEYMQRTGSHPYEAKEGWFIYHKGKGIQCLLPV